MKLRWVQQSKGPWMLTFWTIVLTSLNIFCYSVGECSRLALCWTHHWFSLCTFPHCQKDVYIQEFRMTSTYQRSEHCLHTRGQTEVYIPEARRSVLWRAATAVIQLVRGLEFPFWSWPWWAFLTVTNGFFFISDHTDKELKNEEYKLLWEFQMYIRIDKDVLLLHFIPVISVDFLELSTHLLSEPETKLDSLMKAMQSMDPL